MSDRKTNEASSCVQAPSVTPESHNTGDFTIQVRLVLSQQFLPWIHFCCFYTTVWFDRHQWHTREHHSGRYNSCPRSVITQLSSSHWQNVLSSESPSPSSLPATENTCLLLIISRYCLFASLCFSDSNGTRDSICLRWMNEQINK